MLFYGADVHVLELRGHGLSSVELQQRKAAEDGALPPDLRYGWDIDDYFLQDIPAAIEAVKRKTGRDRIFYCGHSLGGMLGYGYATLGRDLAGLVTIGAPADPQKGYLGVRLLARLGPAFQRAIDAALLARWTRRWATWAVRERLRSLPRISRKQRAPHVGAGAPLRQRFEYYPFDVVLRVLDRALDHPGAFERWERFARTQLFPSLANPSQVMRDDVRWLLREGGEREPRKVVEQLWRWIREGRLCCYRTGYDFRANFPRIRIPMAIIFGDLDPIAGIASTKEVYRAARSEYLLWRPVKGNSHVELTMGHDVRQICFDVKNLIEYARKFPAPRSERTTPGRVGAGGVPVAVSP
jgi:pimeloyl-ACP methyl ester carboxylesterase